MAFIRPYQPADEEAVLHVFRTTAAPDLVASPDPLVLHHGSFLWCLNYTTLTPSYCFVIDDGSGSGQGQGRGRAVGYVISTPDTQTFVSRTHSEFIPLMASKYEITPDTPTTQIDGNTVGIGEESTLAREFRGLIFNPENMLHSAYPNLVGEYPAHLHVDILPSHTGHGWGEKLITTLLEKLKGEGVKGIHLGMVAENRRAGKFYDRIGFERFEEMEDKGEKGRLGDGLYRVKEIR